MIRYFITSNSVRDIISAKTEDAAKMLFQLSHPGQEIDLCMRMAAY